jgi:hypothetical protein
MAKRQDGGYIFNKYIYLDKYSNEVIFCLY